MAKKAKNFNQVVNETLDAAFSDAVLLDISRTHLAPRIQFLVTENAQAGRFIGGPLKNKPYSGGTLPAFFLGKLQKSGDDWQIQPRDSAVRTVNPGDALIWRHVGGIGGGNNSNRATAFLIGGYKKFRELTGRSTSVVNLTMTGRMLGSVRSKAFPTGEGVRIETGATGGQEDKARWTDAKREWLGLPQSDLNNVSGILTDRIESVVSSQPDRKIDLT